MILINKLCEKQKRKVKYIDKLIVVNIELKKTKDKKTGYPFSNDI